MKNNLASSCSHFSYKTYAIPSIIDTLNISSMHYPENLSYLMNKVRSILFYFDHVNTGGFILRNSLILDAPADPFKLS